MGDERCNRVERVLSAQQLRVLRVLLDESPISADPILREGETLDYEKHLTVCYELHHILLPKLADMGFVEFDRFEDEVQRGTRFDEVRQFLEQIDDNHGDSVEDEDEVLNMLKRHASRKHDLDLSDGDARDMIE